MRALLLVLALCVAGTAQARGIAASLDEAQMKLYADYYGGGK